MANGIGVTKGVLKWEFQNSYVERVMDNAAYQAAHPDDTLVLAGPARKASLDLASEDSTSSVLAVGMLQSVQFTQTKPTQPMMAIGSGRSFFVSGKAQTQWNIGRLFVNGRNLLRVLYHNAMINDLPVQDFDDPAAADANANFFINLDSELYYIPFGMACLFRNKVHSFLGAFYSELMMINSFSIGFNAGQNMILENVSGVADRLLPMSASTLISAGGTGKVSAHTVDAILDFSAEDPNPIESEMAEATF